MPKQEFNIEKIYHSCHFCGDSVDQDGYGLKGDRHFLSDCRPDLVAHDPGPLCTWSYEKPPGNCYAYKDDKNNTWGDEHIHFTSDGPM